jgi:tRNA pseudouridine38-40 synthase
VHAAGQVAAFTAETRLDEGIIQRALDALLASDVAVKDLKEVDQAFDPRRWARKRWYRYTVFRAETRDPLWRRFAWHVPEPLNLEAMRRGSELFVGTKDFSACASPIGPGRTSIRTVTVANWEASGCFLRFDIEANAFLPQMVRRLVGSLVLLGRGRLRMPELERLLAERVPATLGPPAPAAGLCLERVSYEGEGQTV